MPEKLKSPNRFPSWVQWLGFGLCLLPPLALALLLRRNAVNVPYWDQWDDDIAGLFLKWNAGDLSFGDFWAQRNESRLVLPRVIFLLLGKLSHWNPGWEVACMFLLAAAAAAAIFWLGRKTLPEHPATRWLAFFIASLLIFSPTQYQAWLWGLELILFLPLLGLLASLLLLRSARAWRTKFIACVILATASTYSFSNGMLVWIALFPVLFLSEGWAGLQKRRRAALLWLLAFAANGAAYFQAYQFPPSPGFWRGLCLDPLRVMEYLCAFFGGPLVNQNSANAVNTGIALGGIQLALFAAVCIVIFRRRENSALMNRGWPWLTLGGYGVLSGLLATTGRAAFGAAQALSPRYGIFAICLTVALVYLVPIVAFYRSATESEPDRSKLKIRWLPAALGAAIIALHTLAWPAAVVNMKVFSLNLRHAKTCLKFLDVLPPQPATLTTLCPNYPKVKRMADALDHVGIWNYSLHRTRRVADFKLAPNAAGQSGAIETSHVAGNQLLLSGWALTPAREAVDCVLFSCEGAGIEPQFFALMDQRLVRTDLVEKFHDENFLLAGWQRSCPLAELPKGALTLKAWSYDNETDRLTPLANAAQLDNR